MCHDSHRLQSEASSSLRIFVTYLSASLWSPTLLLPAENLTDSKCVRHLHAPFPVFARLLFLNSYFHSSLLPSSPPSPQRAMLTCTCVLSVKGMRTELISAMSVLRQVNGYGIPWHAAFLLGQRGTGSTCSSSKLIEPHSARRPKALCEGNPTLTMF